MNNELDTVNPLTHLIECTLHENVQDDGNPEYNCASRASGLRVALKILVEFCVGKLKTDFLFHLVSVFVILVLH